MQIKINASKRELKLLSEFNGKKAVIVLGIGGIFKKLYAVAEVESFISSKMIDFSFKEDIGNILKDEKFKYVNFLPRYLELENKLILELIPAGEIPKEKESHVLEQFENDEKMTKERKSKQDLCSMLFALSV